MFPSAGDELELKPSGLVIAAVAFVLTRFFLVNVFSAGSQADALRVGLSMVPMLLGFAIVVFGVSLSVSTHSRAFARRVAAYYLLSIAAMVLLLGIGTAADGLSLAAFLRSNLVGSALVASGGSGLLLGLQSARSHRQRHDLRRHAEQATLLNRLLRHEVLNSITAIRGHAELLANGGDRDRSWDAVRNNSDRIERVISDVSSLFPTTERTSVGGGTVDLRSILHRCRDGLRDTESELLVPEDVPAVSVRGDDNLDRILVELVTKASDRTDGEPVSAAVDVDDTTVDLRLSAPGSWLTNTERRALLDGPPEYDDPRLEYGISIVRQLVARYDGTLSVTEESGETTVTIELLRTVEGAPTAESPGVDARSLRNAVAAGLIAGVGMGVVLQAFAGGIGIIGSLYGVPSALVGWPVHLFHSVVFATLAAAAGERPRVRRYAATLPGAVALGLGYGVVLWLVAGGVVMGVWLTLIGIPTSVPNLDVVSLVAHLVWGALLGALLAVLSQ
jgi:two-component system OmpR family sensor kinase